jgi:hypothetical protein
MLDRLSKTSTTDILTSLNLALTELSCQGGEYCHSASLSQAVLPVLTTLADDIAQHLTLILLLNLDLRIVSSIVPIR